MKVISSFSGEYSFLSNFYPSIIRIPNNDWEYETMEHFYQAQKVPRDSSSHRLIQDAKTPAEAKKLGRTLKIRQDWDEVKVGIMMVGLHYKFWRHHQLMDKLVATGDALLIEGNTWGDTFWGQTVVNSSDSYKFGEGRGLNVLGTLLMCIRQRFNQGFRLAPGALK